MKNKVSRKAGFTLVEIMIVVAIIGLLAAIAIPNFVRARTTSQQNACINNLRLIDSAKQQWALEQHQTSTSTPVRHGSAALPRPRRGWRTAGLPRGPAPNLGLQLCHRRGQRHRRSPTCSIVCSTHILP